MEAETGASGAERNAYRAPATVALAAPTRAPAQGSTATGVLDRVGAPKVPTILAIFWVIKLLSTAMGESFSDYIVFHIDPYVAVAVASAGLVGALALQLWVSRYRAVAYWLAVVMVAVFGTMVADVLHVVLKVPYVASSAALGSMLAVVFVAWYRSEGTLSIHTIVTPRRELFYWATVMATFALGTALGDLTASTFGLGYPISAALFGVLFVIPGIGYRWLGWDAVGSFWAAYVITRPLGASVAVWLGKSSLGGLGLGDGRVAIGFAVLIAVLVSYLAVTRVDEPRPALDVDRV